jgi:uncharacterized membrane protein YkvA (DUF1232 family)
MLFRLGRLIRLAGRDIVVLWYACRSPATPFPLKLAAAVTALYVVSPIDILPDWIPLVGWVDDLTLLALGVPMLLALVPEPVLRQARAAAAIWPRRL